MKSAVVPTRQIADKFRHFLVQFSGLGLSEIGFYLIFLKARLLAGDISHDANLPPEFSSRPQNGVDLLIKVIVNLQTVIASRSFKGNLSENSIEHTTVVEADCIESIKLLLQDSQEAWQAIMNFPGNLEVIIYTINSSQLDSKCYSLEILILLLDQPNGFVHLFRSLTFICGGVRQELRLEIIMAQLKKGLNTSKLHIQVLIVRLMNKLICQAPSLHQRVLIQIEAELCGFSPDYLENLVAESSRSHISELMNLRMELKLWRNAYLSLSTLQLAFPIIVHSNPIYQSEIMTQSRAEKNAKRQCQKNLSKNESIQLDKMNLLGQQLVKNQPVSSYYYCSSDKYSHPRPSFPMSEMPHARNFAERKDEGTLRKTTFVPSETKKKKMPENTRIKWEMNSPDQCTKQSLEQNGSEKKKTSVHMQGFSYLFPSKPMLSHIPLKLPPEKPEQSISVESTIVRIPISMESPKTYCEKDIDEALSRFDYLNDYIDGVSSKGSQYGGQMTTYHL